MFKLGAVLTLATLPVRGTTHKHNKPGKNNGKLIVKKWLQTRKRFRANDLDRLATKLTMWGLNLSTEAKPPYGVRKQVLAALEDAHRGHRVKRFRTDTGAIVYRPTSAQERQDIRQKLGRQAAERGRRVAQVIRGNGPSRKNGRGYCRTTRHKLAG